jgi:pilus assembly protein FimV
MTPTARWATLSLLLTPSGVWALGLGDIELRSALNQPLDAEIQLVSATEDELSSLRVTLANFETFERYGLDRPAFLDGLTFVVGNDNLGQPVISVGSQVPMYEPFLTVLVEVSWSRGRLLREYTVLLDPPVLLPAPEVVPTIQAATTNPGGQSAPAAVINRSAAEPAAVPAAIATPTATASPAPQANAAAAVAPSSYGPVQPAETLWAIAARYRPDGVTMNQMMVGLYRANPRSFGGNMNTLHQGSTLSLPQAADFDSLTAAAATQEALLQSAQWQGVDNQQARLRLVTPDTAPETVSPAATGAASAQNEPTNVATAGNGAAADAELGELREELAGSQRLLAIRDQQLLALQAQLEAAQSAQADLTDQAAAAVAPPSTSEAGVDLEAEPLFADEAEPASAATPESEAAPAEVTPIAPAAAVSVVTTPSQPSMLSRVLGWLTSPLLLIGLGLAALTGTAVWYLRYRQEDADDVTGRWEALEADLDDGSDSSSAADPLSDPDVTPEDSILVEEQQVVDDLLSAPVLHADPAADDRDDFDINAAASDLAEPTSGETLTIAVPPADTSSEDTISSQTVINLEQADPIAEADFHMAYGLYDQAAELVEKALEADPERRDLKLKLLEVFFVWGNKGSFLSTAEGLRADMGEESGADWDKVVIMGKQICPDEALFSAAPAAADSVDVDLDAGESPALDLAFDSNEVAGVDLDFGDLAGPEVDLELEASGSLPAADDSLDLGDQTSARLETVLLDSSVESVETFLDADDDQPAADEDINSQLAADGEEPTDDDSPSASGNEISEDLSSDLGLNLGENIDADELAATQESPTIETPISPTVEEPSFSADQTDVADHATLESPTLESPTVESPTAEQSAAESATAETPTLESPTVETPVDNTGVLPTLEQPIISADERDSDDLTAEIDLDDLGLDIEDLADLTGDIGVLTDPGDLDTVAVSARGKDELSSSEVSDVLTDEDSEALADDAATLLAPGSDDETLLALGGMEESSPDHAAGDPNVSLLDEEDETLLAPESAADDIESPALSEQDEALLASVGDADSDDFDVQAVGEPDFLEPSDNTDDSAVSVLGEQDATLLASDVIDSAPTGGTERIEQSPGDGIGLDDSFDELGDTLADAPDGDAGIALDDLTAALEESDTVEQPIAQSVGSDVLAGAVDAGSNLDIGSDFPTADTSATSQSSLLDPHTMTMTEVGTKLDLARAYVDMGDPDGARSILEEVLDEGDDTQQEEAQKLINSL